VRLLASSIGVQLRHNHSSRHGHSDNSGCFFGYQHIAGRSIDALIPAIENRNVHAREIIKITTNRDFEIFEPR